MAFDLNLSWQSSPSDLDSSISSISSIGSLSDSSDQSDQEVLQVKRPYAFHERRLLKVVKGLSEEKFRQFFRMERPTFSALLALVKEHLPDGRSTNGMSLLTEEKLLAFLMFCSSNMLLWTGEVTNNCMIPVRDFNLLHFVQYGHDFSEGTMQNCIHQILDVLWNHLVPTSIRLPTVEDARYEAQIFCREANFPAPIVYGAIGNETNTP